ncbi:multidrug and toxin extrusion protein 1-like [Thalassophryne amazonica]|uniref:multidrug and toxin extrusion protein 1-like n=1 Tax=Thalassophryne amazonica TaxID=390379 RepID=UPI001471726F|nr:multidrug and toxin extrusion protein 1-like [Thalassophryne amazonica]
MRMRGFITARHRNELMETVKIAGPVFLSELMIYLISVVSTMFCGHLGKMELAGVALAISVINVTGISVGTGLAQAYDTLIAQTFGSGNLKRVGVILQRGILILLLACCPCWAVLINTESILLALKQTPEVAHLSQIYVKIFMPALPAFFMYQLQARYLQNQGIIWPQVITAVAVNVVNAVINYVLLYYLNIGFVGSAAASAISQYCLAAVLCMYICWRRLHKTTWGGWSLDCLQEWGLFIKMAIPSMLMSCLGWWMFEVGGFLASLISESELGAQSISFQLSVIAYMSPVGFSAAASVRVGSALGAGNIEQAKLSSKVPIICASMIASVVGTILIIAKNVIGYIFTTEKDIIQKVAEVMFLFGFIHVADAAVGVAAGVLRGAGKQVIGALCNLVGYYAIALPVGVSLLFTTDMGIFGLWIGFAVSVALQAIFLVLFLFKLNWEKAAEEALVTAGIQITEGNEVNQMDSSDKFTLPPTCANDEEVATYHEAQDPVPNKSTTVIVGEVLSKRQLIIRRSLTFLLMVFILIAGILINDFLIKEFK